MESSDKQETVTDWIFQLKEANDLAAQKLWERYMTSLVNLARKKLGRYPRKVADEEDVAIIVFEEFIRCAKAGRFPRLNDRQDLWQILVMITDRRAIDLKRRPIGPSGESSGAILTDAIGKEPTPEFAHELVDLIDTLFAALADTTLQTVARLKMAAYSNAQIAEQLGCSERTVERKLNTIRERWNRIDEKTRSEDDG
jgi:RNA polymerase sigma factor (sigma-70 family)